LYKEVGYQQETVDIFKGEQCERSRRLRRKLVKAIKNLFPEHVIVTHLPKCSRSMLLIDRSFMVSILLCRSKRKRGRFRWVIEPPPTERDYITLACTMNSTHDRVLDYFVVPKMSASTKLRRGTSWLQAGVRLHRLSDFYNVAKRLWAQRCKQTNIAQYLEEL